jgi:hypothetical protein
MMKSIGITLNGADPIPQQLEELDAQSRLLCGLGSDQLLKRATDPNHVGMTSNGSQGETCV